MTFRYLGQTKNTSINLKDSASSNMISSARILNPPTISGQRKIINGSNISSSTQGTNYILNGNSGLQTSNGHLKFSTQKIRKTQNYYSPHKQTVTGNTPILSDNERVHNRSSESLYTPYQRISAEKSSAAHSNGNQRNTLDGSSKFAFATGGYQFKTRNDKDRIVSFKVQDNSNKLSETMQETPKTNVLNIRRTAAPFTGQELEWKKFEKFNLQHLKKQKKIKFLQLNKQRPSTNTPEQSKTKQTIQLDTKINSSVQSSVMNSVALKQEKNELIIRKQSEPISKKISPIVISSQNTSRSFKNTNIQTQQQKNFQMKKSQTSPVKSTKKLQMSEMVNVLIQNQAPKQSNTSPKKQLRNSNPHHATIRLNAQEPPLKMQSKTSNVELQLQHEKQKIQLNAVIKKLELEVSNLIQQNQHQKREIEAAKQKIQRHIDSEKEFVIQIQNRKQKQKQLHDKIMQLEKQLGNNKIEPQSPTKVNFDDALKDQLLETAKFRQQIENKDQQIQRLNETILLNRRKAEEAINDAGVEKLKYITELKQMKQKHQIAILNQDNQIKTLKHAMETLEAKLKFTIGQSRTKDNFLQKHLVGRAKSKEEQNYVNTILSQYQQEFPIDRIVEKLLEQQKLISTLRQQLAAK